MTDTLIPPRFLFRFSAPCAYRHPLWTDDGAALDEACKLPQFGELDAQRQFAEVLAGWDESGLAFSVRVSGKRQAPWCREARPDESDGLRICIDTRDTHNIHRATRYCHQFLFLPFGAGRRLEDPVAEMVLINRARENPKPVRPGVLAAKSQKRVDGYVLEAFLPAAALTGFDPVENPRLGFTYAVIDRELGRQSFGCPAEFAFQEDPSLWSTLELVPADSH